MIRMRRGIALVTEWEGDDPWIAVAEAMLLMTEGHEVKIVKRSRNGERRRAMTRTN
jgi:hypothetical protein